ncbi:hypothetical protein ACFLW6_01540 [Chloroflexota bacterium]
MVNLYCYDVVERAIKGEVMARKAVVDKDIVLNMLGDGKTTQLIAEKYSVSRQAIDLYRKDFIKKGLLPDQRAPRIKKAQRVITPDKKSVPTTEPSFVKSATVSLDEHISLVIEAFSALKRLPELEKELDAYKHRYEDALLRIEDLEQAKKKRDDQEQRWILAQSNKDSNTLEARSENIK